MKLKEILIALFTSCHTYTYNKGVITWYFKEALIASELVSVLSEKFRSNANWSYSSLRFPYDTTGNAYLTGDISYTPLKSFAKEVLEEVLFNKNFRLLKNPCAEIQLDEPTTYSCEYKGKILDMKPEMKEMIRVKLNGEIFDLSIDGCEQRTIENILSICVKEINTLTVKVNELNEASQLVNKMAAYPLIYELEKQRNVFGEIYERVGSLPIKDA